MGLSASMVFLMLLMMVMMVGIVVNISMLMGIMAMDTVRKVMVSIVTL